MGVAAGRGDDRREHEERGDGRRDDPGFEALPVEPARLADRQQRGDDREHRPLLRADGESQEDRCQQLALPERGNDRAGAERAAEDLFWVAGIERPQHGRAGDDHDAHRDPVGGRSAVALGLAVERNGQTDRRKQAQQRPDPVSEQQVRARGDGRRHPEQDGDEAHSGHRVDRCAELAVGEVMDGRRGVVVADAEGVVAALVAGEDHAER